MGQSIGFNTSPETRRPERSGNTLVPNKYQKPARETHFYPLGWRRHPTLHHHVNRPSLHSQRKPSDLRSLGTTLIIYEFSSYVISPPPDGAEFRYFISGGYCFDISDNAHRSGNQCIPRGCTLAPKCGWQRDTYATWSRKKIICWYTIDAVT